jgi:mRNA interferase RelE/StbE
LDPAVRELAGLDKPVGRRIVERLRWLATHFDEIRPEGLIGDLAGLYKLRVGDYRVIYEVLSAERTIVIHAMGHRRPVYRRR